MSEPIAEMFIPGRPRTKGSLAPLPVRDGRGKLRITMHDTPDSGAWKRTMIAAIRRECKIVPRVVGRKIVGFDPEPYRGPVDVTAVFAFDRSMSRELDTGDFPEAADIGDVDKLQRNLLDALTQSGLIKDDRFVMHGPPFKIWTDPKIGYTRAGVWFRVEPAQRRIIPGGS